MPNGYAVDVCRHVAVALESRLAIPRISVNYVPASATTGIEMIENGDLDLLCGAVTETLDAREHVSFSIPIYVAGIGALVRKDASPALLRALNGEVPHTGPTWRATVNAGLSNQTYAVYAGSTTEAQIRERVAKLGVIVKVVTVRSHEEGVDLISQGKAGAFFDQRVILLKSLSGRKDANEMTVLDRRFTLEPVGLVVSRGDEDFRLLVDTALSDLYRSGQYVSIYSRHFGEPTETAKLLYQAYALP
jgi:polar amino acid transport system substrate-binding protein